MRFVHIALAILSLCAARVGDFTERVSNYAWHLAERFVDAIMSIVPARDHFALEGASGSYSGPSDTPIGAALFGFNRHESAVARQSADRHI